jgi:hypothetical protein
MSDTVRTAPQSPNFPDNGCFSPPMLKDQSNQQSSYGLTSSQVGGDVFLEKRMSSFMVHNTPY